MTKILIVEDDPAISETVAYNLVSEGYQIQVASDGLEGLELAREMQPDLVILDIMLPKMSGLFIAQTTLAQATKSRRKKHKLDCIGLHSG